MTDRSRQVERDIARRATAHAERRAAEAAEADNAAEHPAPVNPLAEEVARRRQRASARVVGRYPREPSDPAA